MMKKAKKKPEDAKITSKKTNVTKRNGHLWEEINNKNLHIEALYIEIDELNDQIKSERQEYKSIIKVLVKEINETKAQVNHKCTIFSIKKVFTNLKSYIWQMKKNKD